MSEFSPLWGGNEGYGVCDDEEQEKALALLCPRAVTTARSAGGFRGWSWRCSDQPDLRLALFFLKSRLNPRCDRLSGGADAIRRGF